MTEVTGGGAVLTGLTGLMGARSSGGWGADRGEGGARGGGLTGLMVGEKGRELVWSLPTRVKPFDGLIRTQLIRRPKRAEDLVSLGSWKLGSQPRRLKRRP